MSYLMPQTRRDANEKLRAELEDQLARIDAALPQAKRDVEPLRAPVIAAQDALRARTTARREREMGGGYKLNSTYDFQGVPTPDNRLMPHRFIHDVQGDAETADLWRKLDNADRTLKHAQDRVDSLRQTREQISFRLSLLGKASSEDQLAKDSFEKLLAGKQRPPRLWRDEANSAG